MGTPYKKNGLSVETERPLTIACHMKILNTYICADYYSFVRNEKHFLKPDALYLFLILVTQMYVGILHRNKQVNCWFIMAKGLMKLLNPLPLLSFTLIF